MLRSHPGVFGFDEGWRILRPMVKFRDSGRGRLPTAIRGRHLLTRACYLLAQRLVFGLQRCYIRHFHGVACSRMFANTSLASRCDPTHLVHLRDEVDLP